MTKEEREERLRATRLAQSLSSKWPSANDWLFTGRFIQGCLDDAGMKLVEKERKNS